VVQLESAPAIESFAVKQQFPAAILLIRGELWQGSRRVASPKQQAKSECNNESLHSGVPLL
jgi:hypothetical protein